MTDAFALPSPAFVMDELIARPYRPGDAPALCSAVRESIGSLSCWLDWCRPDYGLDDAERWIDTCIDGWRRGSQHTFALFEVATGRFVATVGISQRDHDGNVANLGYWRRDSARGRAIVARVAPHVVAFGFVQLGLDRIEILAATGNLASRRTAERARARFEGIQRNRLRLHGEPVDAATYSWIPGDP